MNTTQSSRLALLSLVILACVTTNRLAYGAPDRTRPNIVLVYADDMGIGDTTAYADLGNVPDDYQIATPSMDRLASMGTRFTDVHSAEAVCTPSRIAMLTGRYSFRSDLKQKVVFTGTDINGSLFTQGGKTRKSVGNLLQDVGYRTYGLGKWHLGVKTDAATIDASRNLLEGPTHVGFDRFTGTLGNPGGKGELLEDSTFVKFTSTASGVLTTAPLSGGDVPSTNWVVNNDDGALQQAKLAQRHINASKSFMGDHAAGGTYDDKPFFLYYASHANHAPYYVADAIQTDANGTPTSVPLTGNTVAGGPIRVLTGPDNDGDGFPDPIDPLYPANSVHKHWTQYYEEDGNGNQIDNPASARADMVQENDVVLGELIDYLEATDDPRNAGGKLIDNTLIIFTSDNGANLGGVDVGGLQQESDGQNTNLRGKKGTPWEGGTRVPFIAAWAGEIQEGLTSDALFGQQDLYATFAEVTNQDLELTYGNAEASDSESVLDALKGTATGVVRDSDLIYKRKENLILRRGNLKLIVAESDFNSDGERIDPGGVTSGLDWQDLQISNLFDLTNDLDETNDLKNDAGFATVRDSMFAALMAAVGPDAEAGFSRGIFADVNYDGTLDASDWTIVKANFGSTVLGNEGLASYRRGDFNNDLAIDFTDIAAFRDAFDLSNGAGAFAAMTAVPEPSTTALILLASTLLATARRKRA